MYRAIIYALLPMIVTWQTTRAEVEDREAIAVRRAIVENGCGLWQLTEMAFANPAVNQWRMSNGYTDVGVSLHHRTDKNSLDPRDGNGDRYLKFGVSSYTKYRTSTLWGDVAYVNGRTVDVVWNETADRELLYPYLLADSIGGDIKMEQYSFSGGYADHNDRWAWGVSMSYKATLQYRDVDPRPKNVVGNLELSAGGMLRVTGAYHVGLSLNLLRYKQTNDIDFKSEMGVDKIFHLTGMGTHYNRFAGNGQSTYYDGYKYGVDINFYPADNDGFFATARLSRLTFKNILSDLNKLPMASVWHNELAAQAGWLRTAGRMLGGLSAQIELFRRHGKENVFGDATSSVYPVITANEMFADNMVRVAAKGRWGMCFGQINRFYIDIMPEWMHRTNAYVEPYNYKVLNNTSLTVEAKSIIGIGKRWMLDAGVSARKNVAYDCALNLTETDTDMRGLYEIERGLYEQESRGATAVAAEIAATCDIAGRYALRCNCRWGHECYNAGKTRNKLDFILSFIF